MNSNNSDADESKPGMRAIFMLEILGKPAEHLTKALENICSKLEQEKGVKVHEKKINKPKELEKKKGFFTSFAELEIEANNITTMTGLMFRYMPAHVEILSPEKIALRNNDLTMLFNELTRRLHGYDEVTRIMRFQRDKLAKQLKESIDKQNQDSKKSKGSKKSDSKEK